jgi:GGDEF domain-containing protein
VGVAVSPHHGTESAVLLRQADAAMYAAKFSGGGSRLYSPDLDRPPPGGGLADASRGRLG